MSRRNCSSEGRCGAGPEEVDGAPSTVVIASWPTMLKVSTHSSVIVETTPSRPMFGDIA